MDDKNSIASVIFILLGADGDLSRRLIVSTLNKTDSYD